MRSRVPTDTLHVMGCYASLTCCTLPMFRARMWETEWPGGSSATKALQEEDDEEEDEEEVRKQHTCFDRFSKDSLC